jgi:dCMP deaminase
MTISLKKNKDGNYFFMINSSKILVDKNDSDVINKYEWCIFENYVYSKMESKLSSIILNIDLEIEIDHINGNTLDNRRCNLRVGNQMILEQDILILEQELELGVDSQYIGVARNSIGWNASININGIIKEDLGDFNREQDAALARDYASKKYYKEFARLNFPDRPGWEEYFMSIAETVKSRSPDYYKVGSILVKDNRIISTGYNSIASGLDHESINWSDRNFINNTIIHAEMNVLLYSNSNFKDSILYTTSSPCISCLKMLSAAKIKQIIYKFEYKDIEKVKELADFFNIELIEYKNIR